MIKNSNYIRNVEYERNISCKCGCYTCRCNKLKKEMEAAQKKEAEDTAAMEKMLEEVEANLLTTTVGSKEASQFDYLGNKTRYQPRKG